MSQLPADCLNEIFEYFELYEYNYKATLRSCLLVNRLWCEVAVRILWRENWVHSTLIACLPNESKEILYKGGIIIPTPTSKPPTFNYAAFCKVISIDRVKCTAEYLLRKNQQPILLQKYYSNTYTVVQEIFKMFMKQISSLRKLVLDYTLNSIDITFSSYPGAEDCLKNLSELRCYSDDIYPEILNQLSQICSNIQTIYVTFCGHISNGLIDLIISQNNLKHLTLTESQENYGAITGIIPSLAKFSHNTLIKLDLDSMTNLHELMISFDCDTSRIDEGAFSELQYLTFPQLQILVFISEFPNPVILINFLENNGENLKELHADGPKGLNLTIAGVCPNLKILTICISNDDLDTLKGIFNNCQHLESLKVNYGDEYLNKYELFKKFL